MQFVRPKQRYYRKSSVGSSSSIGGSGASGGGVGGRGTLDGNSGAGSQSISRASATSFSSSISVLLASAATGHGMEEVLQFIDSFHAVMSQTGALPG